MREAEHQRDAEWVRQQELAARAAMVMEAEEQNVRLQLRKSLDAYNKELAEAQKAKWVVQGCKATQPVRQVGHLLPLEEFR